MATPKKSRAAPSKRKSAGTARRAPASGKAKSPEPKAAAKTPAGAVKGAGARAAKEHRPAGAAPAAAKGKVKGRIPTPPPPVRPLGVLPRESRARTSDRPAAAPAAPVRPAVAARKGEAPAEPAAGQPLSAKDLKHFEDLLMAELKKIRKEMGHLETTVLKVNPRDSSGDLSGYSFHMADAGTDAMEREKAFMFASVEGRKEREIHDALQRIFDGTYGVCENCGQPIARARLEAVPYVRLCVSCKQTEEQASRSQPG